MKRKIKIEEEFPQTRATYRDLPAVPKVRLKGKWLQAAGFNPGAHLELTVIAPGVIELRVCGPVQLIGADFQTVSNHSAHSRRSWARKLIASQPAGGSIGTQ
jgi:hypothetical protein